MAKPKQARFAGSLRVFIITPLGHGKLGVQCPRKDCGGKFIVSGAKWRMSMPQPTRPCAYCFRVSLIKPARDA